MVPLAIRKIVHSIGDDMGMEQRPVAGEILVVYGLASSAELIYDLLHMNGVPDHRSVGEQAQATGLVHDFVDVGIPEFAAVGEEQSFGQRMPMLATVQLKLDAASKRFFVNVPQNIYGFDDPAIGS